MKNLLFKMRLFVRNAIRLYRLVFKKMPSDPHKAYAQAVENSIMCYSVLLLASDETYHIWNDLQSHARYSNITNSEKGQHLQELAETLIHCKWVVKDCTNKVLNEALNENEK